MGILSSILRVLPGFVTPKPNTTAATSTPPHPVTDTDTTATTSHAAASTSGNDITTSAFPPSASPSFSTSEQEMIDHDMEPVTAAATSASEAAGISLTRIVSPFVHKTPHSTTATTKHTTGGGHLHPEQGGTAFKGMATVVAVSGGLPSNKRQESDSTTPTPDIESAILSMDLDEGLLTTAGSHEDGTTKNTSIITENGVMVIHNNDNDKSLLSTAAAAEKEEETYPLVQNRMFDVPEIIRSVAEFLDKPSLAKCCRISKFWSTHCTPLLWRHIVDKHWRFGRFCASIQSQSHYIRSIKCEDWTDYEEMLLCQFPRLKGIAFHGSKESMAVREKILAKVSDTLTSLVLSSVASDLSSDSAEAIQNMHQLTTLKIINMTVNHRHLAEILRQCENLDFLSLSRVQLDESSSSPVLGTAVGVGGGGGGGEGIGLAVERTCDLELFPTRIKYLAMKEVTVSSEYLTGMIRSCPNLLELSFARNETLVITSEMVRVMQENCPRLYAIDIGSCKQLERETFTPLFAALTQITILNLSGTRVGDEDLLFLAQKCRNLVRLDIQYCTQISSKGLHRFLSRCSSTLRHLEASGVTIEPESFDDRAWTCSNLEIMFVHIGLIGSYAPYIPSTAKARVAEAETKEQQQQQLDDSESKKRSLPIEVVTKMETPVSLLTRMLTGVTTATLSPATSTPAQATVSTVATTDHHGQRHCRTAGTSSNTSIHASAVASSNSNTANFTTSKETGNGTGLGFGSATKPSGSRPGQDGDIEMKHALHPIQDVSNVQYLGLMGCGPKLNRHTPCPLLSGFRSIKRLHVLGLYQSFKQEDLEWLVESLPDLCRIDAEKYNVSDEILGWFHSTYPHVRIYRQE